MLDDCSGLAPLPIIFAICNSFKIAPATGFASALPNISPPLSPDSGIIASDPPSGGPPYVSVAETAPIAAPLPDQVGCSPTTTPD